ncbi:hypothetical protein C6P27_02655 [Weissella confusa]|nr:phage holin, LLH family [Weissella confusa]MBJ7653356.1 hypothetical protein [Weissella confusa]MDU2149605.1 phage holin, LLH family [Paeniclostridium sordellii]TGE43924.1 hypothetical protein C6P24_02710 [Weissella confusa]TGE49985.1 hypothetical protein C6P27_02655 [Weissella confusa]
MTMNNLITYTDALWQSGIAPALLILAIGYLSKRFANNRRLVELLKIAEGVVRWAEVNFDGGQTQKAQAIKQLNDALLRQGIGHWFTAKQIDDAIETAVKNMKGNHDEND